jgi:hypothetical protein
LDRNPGDSDDLLDEKFTDARGNFHLDGTTRELTTIEPELRIYHKCEDGMKVKISNKIHPIMIFFSPVVASIFTKSPQNLSTPGPLRKFTISEQKNSLLQLTESLVPAPTMIRQCIQIIKLVL